ncbi:ABC transporter permease [Fodinicola acaciae]|uniref:ABC transporter permease n=1 Tax=Fodinicola acaciae TaxID=2681555 RepID=UPI001FE5E2F5|nr:ABC transporter permease [Fodinicola acaciae]
MSALGWAVADGWVVARRAMSHWVRRPDPLIFSFAFNIMIVLIFAYLFGGAIQVPGGGDYKQFLMPGMFVMSMVFGISTMTIAVTEDASRGIMDRFRSMPMATSAVVSGRAVADMLYATVTLVVMVACGLAIGWRWQHVPLAALGAFALLLLLRFAFVWIGIFLGLVFRSQSAVVAVQTLEFPLGFLSSAMVSPATMPAWLGVVAEWNPLSSTATAARLLFGNPGTAGFPGSPGIRC